MSLNWPFEVVWGEENIEAWCQPASNRVRDFHGDPIKARLVVLSDGNHHLTTEFHVGLVHDGGVWGERFMGFMRDVTAADI